VESTARLTIVEILKSVLRFWNLIMEVIVAKSLNEAMAGIVFEFNVYPFLIVGKEVVWLKMFVVESA